MSDCEWCECQQNHLICNSDQCPSSKPITTESLFIPTAKPTAGVVKSTTTEQTKPTIPIIEFP